MLAVQPLTQTRGFVPSGLGGYTAGPDTLVGFSQAAPCSV